MPVPTNDADTEEKDSFYDLLQQVYDRTPRHDIIITIGMQSMQS